MVTKAEETMDARYRDWSKSRRIEAALSKIVNDGWVQAEAARRYGLNRPHLSTLVKGAREAAEKVELREADQAERRAQPAKNLKQEMPSFKVWFDRYFGNMECPDCEEHHELPEFHLEMQAASQSTSTRRVLINCGTFHAKSTIITVLDTVYDICENRNSRTAIVSKASDLAEAFLYSISEFLTNHDLYALNHDDECGDYDNGWAFCPGGHDLILDYGPFRGTNSTWTNSRIYVEGRTTAEKDPTVLALGVEKQIYGRRFDKIKFDDIADIENQRNPDRVTSMMRWIDKMALTRIGKKGKAVFVGTRVNAGDIYAVLKQRSNYEILSFPTVKEFEQVDADGNVTQEGEVLWPEHFPYDHAMDFKEEMTDADFQLIFQQVDLPGAGAAFTPETMETCRDDTRSVGHFSPEWRRIGGIDPAASGYTAFTMMGVDLSSGKRYVIDSVAHKGMRAYQLKDLMLEWTDIYGPSTWRVENNGLQSQIVQYDRELVRTLALRGVSVEPHTTHGNKWDPQFGVESMAPLMNAGMFSIPWATPADRIVMLPLVEEFLGFPMVALSDRVMSSWFTEIACKELLERSHLPLFNERMHVPARLRRKRSVVDFGNRSVRRIPLRNQRPGHMERDTWGGKRTTVGVPTAHENVEEFGPPEKVAATNVDMDEIWGDQDV